MQNVKAWAPSKFVFEHGRLKASKNSCEVNPASRLMCNLVASNYEAHVKSHCRGRLLDLGCGKVPFYGLYRPYISEAICVDWSKSLHGTDHLDAACDLTQELPFADASFDCVLLSDVLEHIPTPERLWREMARILKPGGKLLLNVPFCYRLHEEPYDYYRYSKYALQRFAQETGFDTILIKELGGTPEIMVDIVAKFIVRFGQIGRWTAIELQAFWQKLASWPPAKRLSERSAQHFPYGYFMIAQRLSGFPQAPGSQQAN
jgi:SAM-dependent methyltransferase